ncbi:hypothetical protein EON63_02910 [archaeon]|nr:MAG: hypothetical protein EON63_02910 [archaeon]
MQYIHTTPLDSQFLYQYSQLKDVFISGGVLHLVMEFCPYDLSTVIYDKSLVLRTPHHKAYLHMMLRGVDCLHSNFVLHRGLCIILMSMMCMGRHDPYYMRYISCSHIS